ncbi:MAG: DNA repair protein RecO [Patescibacteria group bacterium]|nr:DNA repair protein RecO [Patescibacteria group bacterium]
MHKNIYKTEGIVLKRKNYQERDRILTVYTKEYGKIHVIAKGVRRVSSRRSGHLEVFTNARFTLFKGKTFDSVTEAVAIYQFEAFRQDLQKVSFAYYACELVDRLLPERQEHAIVYDRLLSLFRTLSETYENREYYRHVYEFAFNLLRDLGFLPKQKYISMDSIQRYIESLTERKLKTLALLRQI